MTLGARGLLYYEGAGAGRIMESLDVPKERIIDTNGAGDVFHGGYIYSYLINPFAPWDDHFRFARSASAHAIQHLGNEASLPTLDDVYEADGRFNERPERRASADNLE